MATSTLQAPRVMAAAVSVSRYGTPRRPQRQSLFIPFA